VPPIELPRLELRPAALADLVELRDRTLSAGHPGRPVVWPYDTSPGAAHFGGYLGDRLVACVSTDRTPLEGSDPATSYRFHSMGVDGQVQGRGVGAAVLRALAGVLVDQGATVLWATARESALGFYRRMGLTVSDREFVVPETGFRLSVISLDAAGLATLAARP
jgi:GNAT superfamily N-acetyltransferase